MVPEEARGTSETTDVGHPAISAQSPYLLGTQSIHSTLTDRLERKRNPLEYVGALPFQRGPRTVRYQMEDRGSNMVKDRDSRGKDGRKEKV